MYLAKFFHRPPGDDDRELLLCAGSEPCILGIRMVPDGDQFLREVFSDMATAVSAYRRFAEEWREAGFIETDHTRYTLRSLLPDPQPKPQWQRDLDEAMLSALGDSLDAQRQRLARLDAAPANREPLYLWLFAHQQFARDAADPIALDLAQAASDAMVSRKAGQVPFYAWSINPFDLEGRVLELLARAHLAQADPASALEMIEQAREVTGDTFRTALKADILCEYYPERRDEAFDLAYRYGPYGFEDVTLHPLYDVYARNREAMTDADPGWRWSKKKTPAAEADILAAERALQCALPQIYRDFLAVTGKTKLQLRLPDRSSELSIFAPSALKAQRDNLFGFLSQTETPEAVERYFRERYRVAARDLVPVAEPTDISSCIVMHLGAGDRFGWCYRWDHDDPFELEAPQPDFAAAIEAITRGIAQRDRDTLRFFGIFLED